MNGDRLIPEIPQWYRARPERVSDVESTSRRQGHLFITRGDLTALECDAWLVPTDAALTIEHPWDALLEPSLLRPPHGWETGDVRVMQCQAADAAAPTPWLVNVGAFSGSDPRWHVAGAAEFVAAATAHLKESSPRRDRARLLLGLPVVGTGFGGVAHVKGTITRLLVDGLARAAADHGVDVALVTSSDHAFAAAQDARRRLSPTGGTPDPWAELTPESIDLARQLGARARDGHLVLFLGAGIGQPAGLPLWGELIRKLAGVIGISDPSILDRLSDPLDQARILQARFANAGKPLGDAIVELLKPFTRVSLAHTLLAALPVTEAATTNYDTLFEKARRDAGRPVAVLPYEPAGLDGWILNSITKMTSC